jgi:hypothetical protein
MRVNLGSVAFLKAADSGYGIGLDDHSQLIGRAKSCRSPLGHRSAPGA